MSNLEEEKSFSEFPGVGPPLGLGIGLVPLGLGHPLGLGIGFVPLGLGRPLGLGIGLVPLGLGPPFGLGIGLGTVGLGPPLELGHFQDLCIRDLVSLRLFLSCLLGLLLCSLSLLVSDGFLEFRYGRELLVGGILLAQSGELGLAEGLLLSEGGLLLAKSGFPGGGLLLAKGLSTGFLLFLGQGFQLFGGNGAGSGRAVCSGGLRSSQIDFRAGGGCQRP
jgi:hypothetical protein